jgi:hypothetical protein
MTRKVGILQKFNTLHKELSLLVGFILAVAVTSFRLGMYYENIKKEREITEMRNGHTKELLEQKEKYMEKYFELREKNIEIINEYGYGKEK